MMLGKVYNDEHVARLKQKAKKTLFMIVGTWYKEPYFGWQPLWYKNVVEDFHPFKVANLDKEILVPPEVWDELIYAMYDPYFASGYVYAPLNRRYICYRIGADKNPRKDVWCLVVEGFADEGFKRQWCLYDAEEDKMMLYCEDDETVAEGEEAEGRKDICGCGSQQDFEHDEDSGVKKVIRRIFSNMLKFLNSLVCGVLKR